MAAKKPATYCNPFWTESFPDPFMLKVRGRYYAYATEHETCPPAGSWVFPILTSSDLVQWREIGKAMPALWHDWEGTEGQAFLIRSDGTYMISPGHNSLVPGPNNASASSY